VIGRKLLPVCTGNYRNTKIFVCSMTQKSVTYRNADFCRYNKINE
jgi:hypothetical protein